MLVQISVTSTGNSGAPGACYSANWQYLWMPRSRRQFSPHIATPLHPHPSSLLRMQVHKALWPSDPSIITRAVLNERPMGTGSKPARPPPSLVPHVQHLGPRCLPRLLHSMVARYSRACRIYQTRMHHLGAHWTPGARHARAVQTFGPFRAMASADLSSPRGRTQ